MAITAQDKKISSMANVAPLGSMFVPLVDLSQPVAADRNVRASISAILSLVTPPDFASITGKPTTLAGYGITDGITAAAVAAGYQPLDADLTAISALGTTAYGRGFLPLNDASAARAYIGAGTGSGSVTSFSAGNLAPLFTSNVATATTTPALTFTLSNQNANLVFAGPVNGAAAAPAFRSLVTADIPDLSGTYQPLDADLTAISALSTTAYGRDFLVLADAASARAYIGAGTGSGTVTSVGLTMPSGFSVGGSPVTTSGTLAVTTTLSGIVVGDGSGLIARTATGTADRISITNGSGVTGNPTFDIAATYAGQNSITTLGTIATGTWQATTIARNYGGTGFSSYTEGDLLYGNGTGGLSKLAFPGLPGYVLAAGAGIPEWVAYSTVAVTSLSGTANEIAASASTGSVTLSLPSALTFTGKTVTGGTFNSGAFNGTVGANTPSTGAFTTLNTSGLVTMVEAGTSGLPTLLIQGDTLNSVRIGLYAGGSAAPVYGGRMALTSLASPAAVTDGTILCSFAGAGYKDTTYSSNAGLFAIRADGTFTDTSTPTRIDFEVTASGTTSRANVGRITSTGLNSMAIGATNPSTVACTTLTVNGKSVSEGAVDSGGAGFRLLRVAN